MDQTFNDWGQPTRGYILIDTGALFKLAPTVDTKYQVCCPNDRSEPLRYLETIPFLARSGFSCIIPSMVVYEAAEMLYNGECIAMSDYLGKKQKPFQAELQDFFRQSVVDKSIRILPPPENDFSLPASFIRLLSLVHGQSSPKEHKIAEFNFVAHDIFKRGFGDTATRELVRAMPHTDLPVFYLSEDMMALKLIKEIREDLDIRQLTMINFLGALNEQNLFEMMGINNQNLDDVLDNIYLQSCAISQEKFGNFTMSPLFTNPTNQAAFVDALHGIRTDEFIPEERLLRTCTGNCPYAFPRFIPRMA